MKHNQSLPIFILIFFIITSLLISACSGVSAAQPKTYTIGVANEIQSLNKVLDSFKAEMTKLGYVEGENITYIYHNNSLGGDKQANEQEIKRLLDQKVDLLFTLGTAPTIAAKQAVEGTDIPVVFAPVLKPVEEGVVTSLRHPGSNVTGVQSLDAAPKALEWLLKIAPETKKVYIPYNPVDKVSVTTIKSLQDTAAPLGVELISDEVSTADEVMANIKALPKDAAILFIPSPSLDAKLADFKKLAIERGIPAGSRSSSDPTDVIFTCATDSVRQGQQAAGLADKIFKGIKPGDLPVETAPFSVIVNLKTAQAIGLNIPDTLLRQANKVIR
ncbi:MAG: ABC transporter substrate-binding protein [Anaerolineae bacterium]